MRIDFFEEYPTAENLEKARAIAFPSTIYLASHSLNDFTKYRAQLKVINSTLEAAYWPILAKSYWISAFSYPDEIETLRAELAQHSGPLSILLDLELPLLRPVLFLRNARTFFRTKRLIRALLERTDAIVAHTAEYPWTASFLHPIARFLGIAYSEQRFRHQRILMWYSSMIPPVLRPLMRFICFHKKIVGLGTIATGVFGNEPRLSPEQLDRDIAFFRDMGITQAVIFRLGGLSGPYLAVVKKYAT